MKDNLKDRALSICNPKKCEIKDCRACEEMVAAIEAALLQARNEGIKECAEIVNEELSDESDRDDERGHMKSMHMGAMDALRTIIERILSLLPKEEKS